MKRQALVALALVAVYVAVALIGRAERDHSFAEVRSVFAAADVRLRVVPLLLPGCRSSRPWALGVQEPPPCVLGIFRAGDSGALVYFFSGRADGARFVAQQAPFEARVVERRANVLVLSDRVDRRVEAALDALE